MQGGWYRPAFLHAIANRERMRGQIYNVGLSDANVSKRELCETIARRVPGFVFLEAPVGKDPDQRNYIVSNAKMEATGWKPRFSLDAGIEEQAILLADQVRRCLDAHPWAEHETGHGHRTLEGARCSRADLTIVPMIHGKPLLHPDGKVPVIHLSHLELSPDGTWMYFTPLFGPTLWRVEAKYLQNPHLTSDAIAAHVEAVVPIPPVTGISADATGTLYFSALTEDGVLALGRDGKLRTVIRDERISGANEGSIGPDGYYYFPNSQAPRVNRPYEVFKIKL